MHSNEPMSSSDSVTSSDSVSSGELPSDEYIAVDLNELEVTLDYHDFLTENPAVESLSIKGDLINYEQPTPHDSLKLFRLETRTPLSVELLKRIFMDLKIVEDVFIGWEDSDDITPYDLFLDIYEIPGTLHSLTLINANIKVIAMEQEIIRSEQQRMLFVFCSWEAGTFTLLSKKYCEVSDLTIWANSIYGIKCDISFEELFTAFRLLESLQLGSVRLQPSANLEVTNLTSLQLSSIICSDEALSQVMSMESIINLRLDTLVLPDHPEKRVAVESLNPYAVVSRLYRSRGVDLSQINNGIVNIDLLAYMHEDTIPSIVNDLKGIIPKTDLLALTHEMEFDLSKRNEFDLSVSHLFSLPRYTPSYAKIQNSFYPLEYDRRFGPTPIKLYPRFSECRITIKTALNDTDKKLVADTEGYLTCCECVEKLQDEKKIYLNEEEEEREKVTQEGHATITFIFRNRKKEISIITNNEATFNIKHIEREEYEERDRCSSCNEEEDELEYVSFWPYPTPREFSCHCN